MKIRDSRFEMLRILSIFFIILFHFEYFSQNWRLNTIHSYGDFLLESSYLVLGKTGVYLFVMITGYFIGNRIIKIRKSINKSVVIWGEAWFYSMLAFVVGIGMHLLSQPAKQLFTFAFPLMNDVYWFVDGFVVLMLLSPFINICLQHLTQKQFQFLILIVSFFGSLVVGYNTNLFTNEVQTGYLIPAYLIGAYLRKYGLHIKYTKTAALLSYLIPVFVGALMYQIGWTRYINVFYFGIFQLLMATFVFQMFIEASTFHSIVVNKFAKTVFAAYLLTDNGLIKKYLWNLSLLRDKTIPLWRINLIAIGLVIGVLLISFLIDSLRASAVQVIRKIIKH